MSEVTSKNSTGIVPSGYIIGESSGNYDIALSSNGSGGSGMVSSGCNAKDQKKCGEISINKMGD